MSNRISAAAPGLPAVTTRRRALASLAGLGAAISLPKAAKAAAGLDAPDAVLITHAAMVEQITACYLSAVARWIDLQENARFARPRKPVQPNLPPNYKIERGPDGEIAAVLLPPIDPAETLADEQHKAALTAWEKACDDLAENMGVGAAEALTDDLHDALKDVVDDLTPMAATTPAGLAAKARAALALDPHGDNVFDEWENELRASILRDAVRMGGAA